MSTTAAGTPSTSGSLPLQVIQQRLDENGKRPRTKTVTWAADDKLNQVRLFAAEDAPSLSGSVFQDQLEAKKSKFMHALIPVSADDLPPGFEGVATKRARLDTSAVLAMVAQIPWRCPERFFNDPSWQVAMGEESSEVTVQKQREDRSLEAFYPRPSAIPGSSTEPLESPPEIKDSELPQIPLIPTEDEEEGLEEDNAYESSGLGKSISSPIRDPVACGKSPMSYPPGYSPHDDQYLGQPRNSSGSTSAAGRFNPDSASSFFKNANPDVAAAAAAAYAVIKAKESGNLIDHDLLIKILSNPLLIETLTASYPSLRSQFSDVFLNMPPSRETSNGNGLKRRTEPFGEGSQVGSTGSLSSHIIQARQRFDGSDVKTPPGMPGNSIPPAWGINTGPLQNSQGRGFPLVHEQQLSAPKGMLGQVKGVYGPNGPAGRGYNIPRQDISRELIQQHGMAGVVQNEAQLRQSTAPMTFEEVKLGHDLERHRMNMGTGSKGHQWLGGNSNANAMSSSGVAPRGPQERTGGPKIRKQCFFFNTPRGCRNGIYCNYLHEGAPDKPHLERTNSDIAQQARTSSRMDMSDGEAK